LKDFHYDCEGQLNSVKSKVQIELCRCSAAQKILPKNEESVLNPAEMQFPGEGRFKLPHPTFGLQEQRASKFGASKTFCGAWRLEKTIDPLQTRR
jgi:hypothetical protein